MLIDAPLLRRASTANVERLARALGLRVKRRPVATYAARLVSAVAARLRRDAMVDAAVRARVGTVREPSCVDVLREEMRRATVAALDDGEAGDGRSNRG